ncbi:MAG: IS66 family transposase [Treponema sp.]|nr:IS66 family transposase [Treponema sp.]
MENEITLEEALKMLAAAKLQIEEQQQSLQKKDDEIAERDLKINAQIAVINQKDKQLEAEKFEKEQIKLELIKVQEELSSQLAHRFCAHSEKSDNQPSLFDFEDEEFTPSEEEIAETVTGEGPYKEVKVREYIRRKCGRKPIDDSTPTKQIYHDIPEEEKLCACGCKLKKVGENSTKRLRIIPAKMYAIEDIYPKYACPACEGSGDEDKPVFRQAPAVKYLIPKSIATSELLAYTMTNKFCEHLPFYRQEKAFERRCITVTRADMSNWQEQIYKRLKPMDKLIMNHIKSGNTMNMDETTVKVLKYKNQSENDSRKKSYIWLGIGGPKDNKAVIYRYYESRHHKYIKPFINGFKGYLQTDEYPGYETAINEHALLYPDDKIIHVACLAHVRRKFFDASLNGKTPGASKAVKYIQQIYRLEEELIAMNLSPEELVSKRKEIIKPVFDEFHEWLLEMKPKVPPTLMFGRAINYALSAWNHLLNYLDCPELFVDNSISERSIKPFVIGRKNWLFSGSETGAESSCFLFTLIENAKLYKLDPYEYLRCVFDQAPFCESEKDFEKLLPWNIKITEFNEEGTWKTDA